MATETPPLRPRPAAIALFLFRSRLLTFWIYTGIDAVGGVIFARWTWFVNESVNVNFGGQKSTAMRRWQVVTGRRYRYGRSGTWKATFYFASLRFGLESDLLCQVRFGIYSLSLSL